MDLELLRVPIVMLKLLFRMGIMVFSRLLFTKHKLHRNNEIDYGSLSIKFKLNIAIPHTHLNSILGI